MEKQGFLINSESLNYNFSGQTIQNQLSEECETSEIPSVFYLNLKHQGETYLPVTIFQNPVTPLQAIIKYLKENLGFKNKKIALLLNKDTKTIWAAYNHAKKKQLVIDETEMHIPLSIFKHEKLSASESIVSFLKNLGMNYAEIARLLKKDQRTIWTLYSRALKKQDEK